MNKNAKYVNVDDLLDWLDTAFPQGTNGAVDFVCAQIAEKVMTMSYITEDGKKHLGLEDEFNEPNEPVEKPDYFEDFLQDEMIEEEWNG